jgi:hypothetical protein
VKIDIVFDAFFAMVRRIGVGEPARGVDVVLWNVVLAWENQPGEQTLTWCRPRVCGFI